MTHNKRAVIATKKLTTLQARTRLPQKQELFAQMYKDIIKPVMADALRTENPTTSAEKLAIVKRIQKETYEKSSDEIKNDVNQALATKAAEKASLKQPNPSRSPAEYQE